MNRTTALVTVINTLCAPVVASTYGDVYDDSKGKMAYPYMVYDLTVIRSDYSKEVFELEVNIYDYGTIKSNVDNLADSIEDVLDYEIYNDSDIEFIIYKGQRQTIVEENKQIQRRRLTFEIHLHKKGE